MEEESEILTDDFLNVRRSVMSDGDTDSFANTPKDYDTPEKELEDYPDVFADIINVLVYRGRKTVSPGNLQPAATETRYRNLTSGQLKRQTEDIGKYQIVNGEAEILFLLANQSTADSRMVLRKCGYTGGYYRSQYNGQTKDICPVMELVLYWGEKRWSGSYSIRKFFRRKCLSEETWQFIDNEKIHVFEMRHLPKATVKKFTSDMRIVLEFLSDEPDEICFTQKIKHAQAVRELLFVLLGNERYHRLAKGIKEADTASKTEKGECTMRDWIGEAWDKGVIEGMEKGKLEGLKQGMISTCRDLNITFEETAAKLKEKFSLEDAEVQKDMALYW